MPNQITANGIEIQDYIEIVNDIVNGTIQTPGLVVIYGPDINVDSNTPDGGLVNILALSKEDMLQFAVALYNSFNPDMAIGVALDGISQLNGIARKGGTYTETEVVVTTDRTLNLNGLDNLGSTPFTISDSNGTKFFLIETAVLSSGANTLNFRAGSIGFVQILQNTLTVIVTPQLGVLVVNNPSTPYNIGANQETDAQFRLRRQQSTAGLSQRKAMSMYAALNNIVGINQAVVYENVTGAIDTKGVPAHSIWVITYGGTLEEIADIIYAYLSDGCGMKGDTSFDITQIDGSIFTVYFDLAVQQPLYINLNIETLVPGVIDNDAIANYLVANYILGINQVADITSISALIKAYNPNLLVTAAGVSVDNTNFFNFISPSSIKNLFVLTSANINITNT